MDQTSQKIIDAAMELMMEIGYTAATTKDIARRAGVNECTIFRKFGEKKEIVLQAMTQSKWHPDLRPEDFEQRTGNLEEDLRHFSCVYMNKVTDKFVKLSIGLRTPELADDTMGGILSVPMTFKQGLIQYFGEMHQKGILNRTDAEYLAMMFLSLNFGFVFFKASFGDSLTPLTEEAFRDRMVTTFVNGIMRQGTT